MSNVVLNQALSWLLKALIGIPLGLCALARLAGAGQ